MTSIPVVARPRIALGLTILRIIVGIVFIAHGSQKLFVFGIHGVVGAFGQMGVPLPSISAPLIAILEFVGGIGLLFGFLTRIFAALLACDMLGAILLVHLRNGFFLPNGFEFALLLLGACIALAVAGPGDYAIDTRRNREA